MGLDQYAYCRPKDKGEMSDGREIAYWRKHPNLQGWMAELYRKRGGDADKFNGVELELTWEDLAELERAVIHDQLPPTTGFFFGTNSDAEYKQSVLEFVRNARAEIFLGLKVFYNSSW